MFGKIVGAIKVLFKTICETDMDSSMIAMVNLIIVDFGKVGSRLKNNQF